MHSEQASTFQHQGEDIRKMEHDVARSSRRQHAAQHKIEAEEGYSETTR